jgi:hypothetical protein
MIISGLLPPAEFEEQFHRGLETQVWEAALT